MHHWKKTKTTLVRLEEEETFLANQPEDSMGENFLRIQAWWIVVLVRFVSRMILAAMGLAAKVLASSARAMEGKNSKAYPPKCEIFAKKR